MNTTETEIDSGAEWVICNGYFVELALYMALIVWRRDYMTNFN